MVQRKPWTVADYEQAAREYQATLPLEHYMEALPQATQRKITLESLDLVHDRVPEVQVYNELLVQYSYRNKLRQVVPDNLVRLSTQPLKSKGSFNVELEVDPLLFVLEWVSYNSKGKDYKEAFAKYEKELKVPYCLMYYPDEQDLRVWRHNGKTYDRLEPNPQGRYSIPELELEIALEDGWVRYWHRGDLLPLPGELRQQLDKTARQRDEIARQRDEIARQRDEIARQRDEMSRQHDEERRKRESAEAEIARLKQQLAEATGSQPHPDS